MSFLPGNDPRPGEALKAHCARLVEAAEDKVEKIRLSREGKPVGVDPLDPE